MRRVAVLTVLCLLAALPAAADPLPATSDRVVSYDIRVALDTAKRQIKGTEKVTWRNPSAVEQVPDLQFHFYLNAFKNDQSVFMQESRGQQ